MKMKRSIPVLILAVFIVTGCASTTKVAKINYIETQKTSGFEPDPERGQLVDKYLAALRVGDPKRELMFKQYLNRYLVTDKSVISKYPGSMDYIRQLNREIPYPIGPGSFIDILLSSTGTGGNRLNEAGMQSYLILQPTTPWDTLKKKGCKHKFNQGRSWAYCQQEFQLDYSNDNRRMLKDPKRGKLLKTLDLPVKIVFPATGDRILRYYIGADTIALYEGSWLKEKVIDPVFYGEMLARVAAHMEIREDAYAKFSSGLQQTVFTPKVDENLRPIGITRDAAYRFIVGDDGYGYVKSEYSPTNSNSLWSQTLIPVDVILSAAAGPTVSFELSAEKKELVIRYLEALMEDRK